MEQEVDEGSSRIYFRFQTETANTCYRPIATGFDAAVFPSQPLPWLVPAKCIVLYKNIRYHETGKCRHLGLISNAGFNTFILIIMFLY
jgi:hypothetical protein